MSNVNTTEREVNGDYDDVMCIICEVKKLQVRISNLLRQRSEELERLFRLTSCPFRKNSFGKYELFKTHGGGVDDRYNISISVLMDRINKLERRKKRQSKKKLRIVMMGTTTVPTTTKTTTTTRINEGDAQLRSGGERRHIIK